jgi:hypothetical protein
MLDYDCCRGLGKEVDSTAAAGRVATTGAIGNKARGMIEPLHDGWRAQRSREYR